MINIENYEKYVLDYLEGNLNEELNSSFKTFLILNPEIAEEIDGILDFKLEPDMEVFFSNPNSLKKTNIFISKIILLLITAFILISLGFYYSLNTKSKVNYTVPNNSFEESKTNENAITKKNVSFKNTIIKKDSSLLKNPIYKTQTNSKTLKPRIKKNQKSKTKNIIDKKPIVKVEIKENVKIIIPKINEQEENTFFVTNKVAVISKLPEAKLSVHRERINYNLPPSSISTIDQNEGYLLAEINVNYTGLYLKTQKIKGSVKKVLNNIENTSISDAKKLLFNKIKRL